jgi:AraC-like DNA-binding protein
VSRAQEQQLKDSSIIDVAVACGFSGQSHMTGAFRHRFEMTPAEFRRNRRG